MITWPDETDSAESINPADGRDKRYHTAANEASKLSFEFIM